MKVFIVFYLLLAGWLISAGCPWLQTALTLRRFANAFSPPRGRRRCGERAGGAAPAVAEHGVAGAVDGRAAGGAAAVIAIDGLIAGLRGGADRAAARAAEGLLWRLRVQLPE